MKILHFAKLLVLLISLDSYALTSLSWEETTINKDQLFIGDSEVLSDEFDAIKVKIVNSTYHHTMSYAPKFLTFDYELEKCPITKNLERELTYTKMNESINIGHLKYWYSAKKCKIFITLKTPYINVRSIFYK